MTRPVTCVVLSLMLVFCTFAAAHRGLAALYAYPGKSSLAVWREGKRTLQLQDWNTVRDSLVEALSYDGRNPDLLQALGAAHEAEVAFYPPGDTAAARNRGDARQYYLEALEGRPSWPHDWVALALVKYRLGEIDAEFNRALQQAVTLGPWEPGVQFVVADIGMHHWDRFDQTMRDLVTGIIHDAVKNTDTARDMLDLVKRYDMPALVCAGAAATEQVLEYCEQNRRRAGEF